MKFDRLGLSFDTILSARREMAVCLIEDVYPDVLFYGTVPTKLGEMTLVWCDFGLCYLGFQEKQSFQKVSTFFPECQFKEHRKDAKKYADRVMSVWAGERVADILPLVVRGTDFQRDVWATLLRIPVGHVVSYGLVAQNVGRPDAVRAVGSAVGANPVSLLIPCHRVIQKNGSVCNYGWGDVMKQKILSMESNPDSKNPAYCKSPPVV
ncbi:MAG: methylated-DNA--[protein]-cysteine S-methyltransferase [Alphaproteobacteria bacterium]|nr:methylated-DNA--[protein]-cysteine S-methyltransferase [Alphaproteobacteria bacterium]